MFEIIFIKPITLKQYQTCSTYQTKHIKQGETGKTRRVQTAHANIRVGVLTPQPPGKGRRKGDIGMTERSTNKAMD